MQTRSGQTVYQSKTPPLFCLTLQVVKIIQLLPIRTYQITTSDMIKPVTDSLENYRCEYRCKQSSQPPGL
jgi:hypothetical protein